MAVKTTLVRWIDAINDAAVQVIVEVRNSGGSWADLSASQDYTLFAKDGSVTTTGSLTAYPEIIGPGQTGYLLDETSEDGGKVSDFNRADVSIDFSDAAGPGPTLTFGTVKTKVGYFGDGVDVTGTITNKSTDTIDSIAVAAVLFDSSKQPIGYNWNYVEKLGPGKLKGFVLGGGRDLKLSTVAYLLTLAQ